MKCVPVYHGIPAVLHRDEPWLHRHSENGPSKIYYINHIFSRWAVYTNVFVGEELLKRELVALHILAFDIM